MNLSSYSINGYSVASLYALRLDKLTATSPQTPFHGRNCLSNILDEFNLNRRPDVLF